MKTTITQEMLEKRIFQQFINPTNQKKDYIGIEIEVPIINLNKKAVDFDIVHRITKNFMNHFNDFKQKASTTMETYSQLKTLKTMISYAMTAPTTT